MEFRFFLVCYDIANPKRLTRVHRYLRGCGLPLQYSVFLVQETTESLSMLVHGLNAIINAREDDVRIYPLNSAPEYVALGQQQLPEGLQLLGVQVSESGGFVL